MTGLLTCAYKTGDNAMEIVSIIVSMLGGLALFLYGMCVMSETLSRLTGGYQ